MEVVKNNQLLPGDPRLIDHIVSELKSQGIFDQFRKECIADVDTKPAYQNLRQRVEGNVANFLNLQKWRPDMNKNQLREMLRKNIQESGYLDTGVERIVDQVVNPKISTIFFPQVEDVVYKFLGIEKPEKSSSSTNSANGLSVNTSGVDLLPTDLDPISPASDKSHNKSTDTVEATKSDDDNDNNDKLDDSLKEDDESPPFEPIEDTSGFLVQDESSVDSHLSGISGLTSHDSNSNHSSPKNMATLIADVSNNDNNDSDLSKVSSDSRLSVVTSDGKSSPDDKMVICDDNSNSKNSQINNLNQDSHSSSEHSLRIDLEQNSNDEVDNRNEMKTENINTKHESIQDISENAVNGSDMEKSSEKHFEIEVPAEKDNIIEQTDIRENSVEKVNSVESEKNEEVQTSVSKSRRHSRHSENKDRRSDRDRRSDKDRRDRHDSGSRDKYKESKGKDKSEKEKNYSKEYMKELSTDSSESPAQDKKKDDKLKERSEKSRDDKFRDERSKDRTDKMKDEKLKDKEKSKHSRDSDSKSRDDKHKSRSSSKHGSSKSSSRRDDRRDSSKDYHESRDKSKYSSKDSKSSSKTDKDGGKRDSSRDSKHSESKSKLKETKHSKDGKDLKDSKDGKESKDKEKDGKETDSKHKGRNRTRSEGSSQNSHRKSSSSHDQKDKDKKKDADVKKNSKDDHFSSKDKTSDSRRSTDRDSNDGSSGASNKNSGSSTNSQSQSRRSQGNSRNSDNTSSGSNSRDSGQSDKMQAMQVVDIFQAKLDEANNIMFKKVKSPSKAVTLDLSDSEFTISPASNIIQNKIMQNKRQLSLDDSSDNSEQKSPKRQKTNSEQTNEEIITNENKEEIIENIPVENDAEEVETDTDSLQNNIQNELSNSMLQSKIRKPKFASNIFEARKLMKIRKKMEKIERKRQLQLNILNFQSLSDTKTPNEVEKENVVTACESIEPSCSSDGNSSKEKPKSEEKKNNKIDVHSICLKDAKIILTKLDCDVNLKKHMQENDKKIELNSAQTEQESSKKILSEVCAEDENEPVVPKSSVISKESWDALEEKLQSKEIMMDYSSYDYETENDSSFVKTDPGSDIVYSDDDDDCLYLSNTKPEVERYLERIETLQKGGLTIGNILDDVPKTENTESSSLEKTIVVNRRLRKPNLKYSANVTENPVPTIEKQSTEQNNKKVDNKKKLTRSANKRKITEVLSLDNNDIENENNNVTSTQIITDVTETEDEKKENAPEISLTGKLNIKPIRSGKRGKKNEIITASNTNEAFVLPPSPESDVSASSGELKINNTKLRVKEQVASPVPKTKANKSAKLAAQRYSSDDLYKPRPMFGGTRRSRASLNNSVSDADLITPSKRRK